MATPFCGFLIWHVHKNKYDSNLIASLPFVLLFTEWYFTVFTDLYVTAKDKLLLFIAYLCMALSLLAVIPVKKRLFGLICGAFLSIILILLVQAGVIVNLYEEMLNI